ncbi:hypothetical protein ACUXIZ_003348 [Cytobacillus horneckiae]
MALEVETKKLLSTEPPIKSVKLWYERVDLILLFLDKKPGSSI